MKKCISLVLILWLLVIFSACSSSSTQKNQELLASIMGRYPVSVGVDEYNLFIAECKDNNLLPQDFRYLEDIPNFSDSIGFVPSSEHFPNVYEYTFFDAEMDEIDITITHPGATSPHATYFDPNKYASESITDDMTTMEHKVASNTLTVIERSGMNYYYNERGSLSWIVLNVNGYEYFISGHFDRFDTPDGYIDINNLLSVNEETANATITEIKQILNAK